MRNYSIIVALAALFTVAAGPVRIAQASAFARPTPTPTPVAPAKQSVAIANPTPAATPTPLSAVKQSGAVVTATPTPVTPAKQSVAIANPTPAPTPKPLSTVKQSGAVVTATPTPPKGLQTVAPATNPKALPAASSSAVPRPINSMTANDRMNLPDTTMVKVGDGRIASLGTLRAEHRARLERFARARSLGQSMAGQLVQASQSSAQPSPAATMKGRSSSSPAAKSSVGSEADLGLDLGLAKAGVLIPLQIPHYNGAIAKDYVDFCKAANASACIYLPNSTLRQVGPPFPRVWVSDDDPLITDKSACEYDGGVLDQGGCHYFYPTSYLINFTPIGKLSVKVACQSILKYIADPKGAIGAYWPDPGWGNYLSYSQQLTCVVQGRLLAN